MHNIQSVLLGKKTLRGASPKLKKRKRLTLMDMILQIKSVSLEAKWGIFASTVLPSRDNKPCQYRLKQPSKDTLPPMPEGVSLGKRLYI